MGAHSALSNSAPALAVKRLDLNELVFDRALVELDKDARTTLSDNSELHSLDWNVINEDIREFDATRYKGIDVLAGGSVPAFFSRW